MSTGGLEGLNIGSISSMVFDTNNIPYALIPYVTGEDTNYIVVKYIDNAWIRIGEAFTGYISMDNLILDANNVPYVNKDSYNQETDTHTSTIMKFDGNTWIQLGDEISNIPNGVRLFIDKANTPYTMINMDT